jgi:hypothetical protein
MRHWRRLAVAATLIFAAGSRTIEVVILREELATLRSQRTADEARLIELRGLRQMLTADPALAAAIADRWVRGELLLP